MASNAMPRPAGVYDVKRVITREVPTIVIRSCLGAPQARQHVERHFPSDGPIGKKGLILPKLLGAPRMRRPSNRPPANWQPEIR